MSEKKNKHSLVLVNDREWDRFKENHPKHCEELENYAVVKDLRDVSFQVLVDRRRLHKVLRGGKI